jgi:hypothetical protein
MFWFSGIIKVLALNRAAATHWIGAHRRLGAFLGLSEGRRRPDER